MHHIHCVFSSIIGKRSLSNSEHDITVTGVYGYINATVNSRLKLPKDLSISVDEVKVFHVDENLSGFKDNVLKHFKNDEKVLIIIVSDFSQLFDTIQGKLSQDDVLIYYAWNDKRASDHEVSDWICGMSSKKYLITDHLTVTGFEFETVLIVADAQFKNDISSLYQ